LKVFEMTYLLASLEDLTLGIRMEGLSAVLSRAVRFFGRSAWQADGSGQLKRVWPLKSRNQLIESHWQASVSPGLSLGKSSSTATRAQIRNLHLIHYSFPDSGNAGQKPLHTQSILISLAILHLDSVPKRIIPSS
jgi:hypothetical protein